MSTDKNGNSDARSKRNYWEKEIFRAKKILYVKVKNKSDQIKLIFVENIDFQI